MNRPPTAPPARGGLATDLAPPLDLPFRFMATALGWLAVLAAVYPWHTPLLAGSFYDPHLLTFVHVNTLGVIGATIMGASCQLLPVVLQVRLASVRLMRLAWWLYLPGLLAFVLGMSQAWLPALALGGSLAFAAVALYVGVVVATLRRAATRDATFWHLAAGVVALAVGASLGLLMAATKGSGALAGLTLPVLAAHATLMLAGWVTPTLCGVAYRLIGMFTLTEDRLRQRQALVSLALEVAGAWTLAAALLFSLPPMVGAVGATALLGGVGVFVAQAIRLYRVRRRRTFDIHIPFALTAMSFGILAVGLALVGFATGRTPGDPIWVAVGWWAIAGWAETAILGFMYKIGTFLTWLNRYAPLAGRRPVPKLDELYGRRTAVAGWAAWTAGVGLGGIAALTTLEPLSVVAGVALSVGAVAFLVNAARVGLHWRREGAAPSILATPSGRAA